MSHRSSAGPAPSVPAEGVWEALGGCVTSVHSDSRSMKVEDGRLDDRSSTEEATFHFHDCVREFIFFFMFFLERKERSCCLRQKIRFHIEM